MVTPICWKKRLEAESVTRRAIEDEGAPFHLQPFAHPAQSETGRASARLHSTAVVRDRQMELTRIPRSRFYSFQSDRRLPCVGMFVDIGKALKQAETMMLTAVIPTMIALSRDGDSRDILDDSELVCDSTMNWSSASGSERREKLPGEPGNFSLVEC
jgi:hypothetical protein